MVVFVEDIQRDLLGDYLVGRCGRKSNVDAITDIELITVFCCSAIDGNGLFGNQLLNDGAGELDTDQLAAALDSMGIEFGSSSSRDMSRATLKTLTDPPILDRAVELFATILSKPLLPAGALERERSRTLVGLQRHPQSPASVASEAFWAAMYPGHVYGRFGAGSEETLASISRDDIVGFHQRYYVARNGVMVLVGDVSRGEAEQIANRVSGGLPAGGAFLFVA